MKKNILISFALIILLAFSGSFVRAQETKEQKEEQQKTEETKKEEEKKTGEATKEEKKKAEKAQKEEKKKQKEEQAKQKKEQKKLAKEQKKKETAEKAEEQKPERGEFFISFEDWYAKIANVDYQISTRFGEFPTEDKNISGENSLGNSARYRLGWKFKNDLGSIEMDYWGISRDDTLIETDAGNFIFLENLAFPFFAGVYDDGMADGVMGRAQFAARSFSLLYSRPLLKNERLSFQWRIGIRNFNYTHKFKTQYMALIPVLINPFPAENQVPQNDLVTEESITSGRGIETGASVSLPISKRVSFGTDLGYSFLMGHSDVSYISTNYLYLSGGSYINVKDVELSSSDVQAYSIVAINDKGIDSFVQIIDVSLRFTWNVWRKLDLTFGYSYALWNGALLREQPMLIENYPLTYNQTSRLMRSNVAFEGAFLGLMYRY